MSDTRESIADQLGATPPPAPAAEVEAPVESPAAPPPLQEAAPIREQLAAMEGSSAQATAAHRRLEALRERLMTDDEALTQFAAEHLAADIQGLRTLIRNARKEQKEGKPPRAYRELFRALKDIESPKPVQG